MVINLNTNDLVSILSGGGKDYFKLGQPDPVSPYTRYPGGAPVTPAVLLFTVTAPDSVKVDPLKYIQDANGGQWQEVVGTRPTSIVRR